MRRCAGFTLLELLLALSILSVVTVVTFMTFSTVTTAWRKGQALSDTLHHGEFVMEQLVMALRSTYYGGETATPESRQEAFGFWHEDGGSGAGARDVISWVKLGSSLVGKQVPYAENPHRVRFFLTEDDQRRSAAAFTAWQVNLQVEDFDPDLIEPVILTRHIVGFNCRMANQVDAGEIEWEDVWEDNTNTVPRFLELTLYMEPSDAGSDPVELKRLVSIPVHP